MTAEDETTESLPFTREHLADVLCRTNLTADWFERADLIIEAFGSPAPPALVDEREREEWQALSVATTLRMLPVEAVIASVKHLATRLLELTAPQQNAESVPHDELARRIFDEVSAVLGPLHSAHLDRVLGVEDVLDAVHIATDDDTQGSEKPAGWTDGQNDGSSR